MASLHFLLFCNRILSLFLLEQLFSLGSQAFCTFSSCYKKLEREKKCWDRKTFLPTKHKEKGVSALRSRSPSLLALEKIEKTPVGVLKSGIRFHRKKRKVGLGAKGTHIVGACGCVCVRVCQVKWGNKRFFFTCVRACVCAFSDDLSQSLLSCSSPQGAFAGKRKRKTCKIAFFQFDLEKEFVGHLFL